MAFRIASLLCLWVFVARRPDGFGHVLAQQQRLDRYDLLVMDDALLGNETNSTDAPTDANSTAAPTMSPGNSTGNNTLAPTMAPTSSNSTNHTQAPATSSPATKAPVPPPAPTPVSPPVQPPTSSPSAAPHASKPHFSFWRIIGHTIAWMILLLLGTIALGAVMQHRYRIYYFARGCYFTVLQMSCTQWILRKLSFERAGSAVDTSLNTILFSSDSEMTEGLLMQESNE